MDTKEEPTSLSRQQQQLRDETVKRGKQHHQRAIEALNRGQRDLANRDLDRAITDFTKVIEIDPKHSTAYLLRARVYEERGEDDKAESDLSVARELETG